MQPLVTPGHSGSTRRDFLRTTTAAGAATLASASGLASAVYAGEQNTIKVALVGCGNRGPGATVNALRTAGPTQLYAMADFFDSHLQASLLSLGKQFPKQVDVPKQRQFIGLDAFKKAIDAVAPGGLVILATPPAFRPIHFEYAVAKGCHVFVEKSFGVDPAGVRRILRASEEAKKKNLKVAGGLMSRHYKPLEQAIQQIHDGAIGEPLTLWCYREHGPAPYHKREPGMNELAHQIHNYCNFTWLNGTFILDWLIHNLDVCCWVKNAWPISAQGQGGRQVRSEADQMFDHFAVEYHYADGTRMMAQARHINACWSFFGNVIQGSSGTAVLGEGIAHPRIYKGYRQAPESLIWESKAKGEGYANAYQGEHDLLFQAIRDNQPYNEMERCCNATMVGIMGRMAAESGKEITWEDAMASQTELAPGLENFTADSEPPVKPDADGRYPVALPGKTSPV